MLLARVHTWTCQEASTWVSLITACDLFQIRLSLLNAGFLFVFFSAHFTEPLAEIKMGLVNSTAISGEEFSVSVELSAVCSGFWSLNGRLLRSGADYLITRTKNTHTLLIRLITTEMDGAQIKFVGGGSQTSCTMSVKGKNTLHYASTLRHSSDEFCVNSIPSVFLAPPVRFTNKSELLKVVACSAQATAHLNAEVSDYDAKVCRSFCFSLMIHSLLMHVYL